MPIRSLFTFFKKYPYTACALITDEIVYNLYGKDLEAKLKQFFPVYPVILIPGEKTKTLATATSCWNTMHACQIDRKSVVVCLGGGTITDIGGFVAACYMRGIDVVHIPTTLMGMVDAAIGGKCGVNLENGKNIVGAFHQPKYICINPHYLSTLPDREFRSAISEVIKYGIIQDCALFEFLENKMPQILNREEQTLKFIINRSREIKETIVSCDEKENHIRAILNWGHTFAHALETVTGYNKYLHGEAVAIGMNCAAKFSHALGYVNKEFVVRQKKLIQWAGLPLHVPNEICKKNLLHTMLRDKKNVEGKLRLIIAKGMANVTPIEVSETEFLKYSTSIFGDGN